MKIKVYQIDREHDDKNVMFMGYDFTMSHGGIDPSDYKCVFDGNVECSDLEEIFTLCNEDHPIGYLLNLFRSLHECGSNTHTNMGYNSNMV